MLGINFRATYAVRDGVSRTALRSERFFVFSRETRKAGNVRGPAVANPSHCERESPVRTKPWPSRRSVKDLRRNGNLPILSDRKGQQSSLYGRGRDPVRRRTGSKPGDAVPIASPDENRAPVLSNLFFAIR